jgi:hypothetical protein
MYQKKNNIFIIFGIGLIGIIIGFLIISSGRINQLISSVETGIPKNNIRQEVILVIGEGEGTIKTFETEFKEGMTAFDLLKEKTGEVDLTLKFKTYDVGVFIEVIGDKENGEDGKYWLYYVNGEMSQVASDKQLLVPGDKVEFKFEKSPF